MKRLTKVLTSILLISIIIFSILYIISDDDVIKPKRIVIFNLSRPGPIVFDDDSVKLIKLYYYDEDYLDSPFIKIWESKHITVTSNHHLVFRDLNGKSVHLFGVFSIEEK